jgi:Phage integrase family
VNRVPSIPLIPASPGRWRVDDTLLWLSRRQAKSSRRRIRVDTQLASSSSDTSPVVTPMRISKTEAGERTVPMFGSARRVLVEQKARSRFKQREDLIFPNAAGHPERPADWARREFLPARKRAGLRDSLRLHDLRHYAVSRLIEQGANVLLASRVAGHARASVTLDVYAHLSGKGSPRPPNASTPLNASPPWSRGSPRLGDDSSRRLHELGIRERQTRTFGGSVWRTHLAYLRLNRDVLTTRVVPPTSFKCLIGCPRVGCQGGPL